MGYQLTTHSLISFNVYDITVNQPIVYFISSDTSGISTDNYINSGYAGTQGVEVEYKFKNKKASFFMNYAFYAASNKDKIELYKTPSAFSLLGFANHRLNLNASFKINNAITINSTASYFGKRYFISNYDTTGLPTFNQLNPNLVMNLYFSYQTPIKGLTAGAGVYDIFDEHPPFVQPYDGGHAPLPNAGREFLFRIIYRFNSNNSN